MTTRIWVGALLTVFVALTITAHVRWAARAGAADVPGEMAPNEFGVAESVHRTGLVDRSNPFFLELGVNGRTCESCLDGRAGWTITPAFARRLFKASDGLAALFRIHDAGSPPRRRHRDAGGAPRGLRHRAGARRHPLPADHSRDRRLRSDRGRRPLRVFDARPVLQLPPVCPA